MCSYFGKYWEFSSLASAAVVKLSEMMELYFLNERSRV